MPNLAQMSDEKFQFVLVIGDSGTGKTCAMASYPGKTEIHDWDRRVRGIKGHPGYTAEKLADITVNEYTPGSGFKAAETKIEARKDELQARRCAYQNFLFDSVSSMGDELLSDAMQFTEGDRKVGSLHIPGPQDYLYESEAFRQLIFMHLKSFQCNVFVSAHIVPKWGKSPSAEKFAENVVIGERILGRDKVSAKIPTFFDNVWYFEKATTFNPPHYICHFRNKSIARTTFRNLPDKIDWTWIPGKQEKLFHELIADKLPRGED